MKAAKSKVRKLEESNALIEDYEDKEEVMDDALADPKIPLSGMVVKKGTFQVYKAADGSSYIGPSNIKVVQNMSVGTVFNQSDNVNIHIDNLCLQANGSEVLVNNAGTVFAKYNSPVNANGVCMSDVDGEFELFSGSNIIHTSGYPAEIQTSRAGQVQVEGSTRPSITKHILISQKEQLPHAMPLQEVGMQANSDAYKGSVSLNNYTSNSNREIVFYPLNYMADAVVLMDTSRSSSFENKRIKNGLFLFEKIRKLNVSGLKNILALGRSLYKVYFETIKDANESIHKKT